MAVKKLWTKDGKLVVAPNGSRPLIECDRCPCVTDCSNCTASPITYPCIIFKIRISGTYYDYLFYKRGEPACVDGHYQTVYANPVSCTPGAPSIPSGSTITASICMGISPTISLSFPGTYGGYSVPHTCECPPSPSSSSSAAPSGCPTIICTRYRYTGGLENCFQPYQEEVFTTTLISSDANSCTYEIWSDGYIRNTVELSRTQGGQDCDPTGVWCVAYTAPAGSSDEVFFSLRTCSYRDDFILLTI